VQLLVDIFCGFFILVSDFKFKKLVLRNVEDNNAVT
jgi:hypothetical protein